MKTKKDYSILRQPISEENISRISELIVLRAIKTHCGYDHKFDRLYKGLLCDMFDKNKDTFTFSDAYDLVQEGLISKEEAVERYEYYSSLQKVNE